MAVSGFHRCAPVGQKGGAGWLGGQLGVLINIAVPLRVLRWEAFGTKPGYKANVQGMENKTPSEVTDGIRR